MMEILPVWDEKNKLALLEGAKKAACVATNAAMFFFFPAWVFGDQSWFPADPVWVHITITMLCELDSMDRLNEKILLRTAGTTIGAVSGCVMNMAGLTDVQRLVIIIIWITTLGFIEKKDPARSYTWTIATVTFGICTYLGRMGKFMTPWKRWFSIVLGTLVSCFYLLLLPYLGVLPKVIVRDELGETAKKAWSGCVVMLEDAIENSGDAEAGKRLSEKQISVHTLFTKYPALWKQYKYARNWINLQPKKALPMDSLQALLKGPLFDLFLSTSAAARMLHRTGQSPAKNGCAALRVEMHTVGSGIASVVAAVATKNASNDVRLSCMQDLEKMIAALEEAAKQLGGMPHLRQAMLAACLIDTAKVIMHIKDAIGDVQGSLVKDKLGTDALTARCTKLLKDLKQVETSAVAA